MWCVLCRLALYILYHTIALMPLLFISFEFCNVVIDLSFWCCYFFLFVLLNSNLINFFQLELNRLSNAPNFVYIVEFCSIIIITFNHDKCFVLSKIQWILLASNQPKLHLDYWQYKMSKECTYPNIFRFNWYCCDFSSSLSSYVT